MTKRFLIYPGHVISKNDGQRHWVSGGELIRLYGLDYRECVIVDYKRQGTRIDWGLLALYPRNDGDYEGYLLLTKKRDFQRYREARKQARQLSLQTYGHTVLQRYAIIIARLENRWPDFYDTYKGIE